MVDELETSSAFDFPGFEFGIASFDGMKRKEKGLKNR
jgi:hypothetical protein